MTTISSSSLASAAPQISGAWALASASAVPKTSRPETAPASMALSKVVAKSGPSSRARPKSLAPVELAFLSSLTSVLGRMSDKTGTTGRALWPLLAPRWRRPKPRPHSRAAKSSSLLRSGESQRASAETAWLPQNSLSASMGLWHARKRRRLFPADASAQKSPLVHVVEAVAARIADEAAIDRLVLARHEGV